MTDINIMALRHSAFYAPLLVAMSEGYLAKAGLRVDYAIQSAGNTVSEGIRSGRVHLAQSAVATSFAGLEARLKAEPEAESNGDCDIVHFAQINQRDGFFIAAREPDEDFRWEKLIGRDVLVDHLFQPLAMLRYGLHRQGIDFDTLNVIDAGDVAQIDTAFRGGRGDYVHQQGPAPQQLEKDGVGHVVAAVGELVGRVAFSSLCATREWLETDMAGAFMQVYRQARAFVASAPAADTARIIGPQLPDIDADVLESTIATYQQSGCWAGGVEITRDAYENLLDVFLHSGLISRRHAYGRCVVKPPPS